MTQPTETPMQAALRFASKAIRDGFEFRALHEYTDKNGNVIYWRIRLKHPAFNQLPPEKQNEYHGKDKWICPMRLIGNRYDLKEPECPLQGKVLYRLHESASRPTDPVWITEGENKADLLASLGLLATTSGAADFVEKADWTPLEGRTAVIWRDNDDAGIRCAKAATGKLQALDCVVRLIDVAALDLPPGGDAVDWLAAHPNTTAADVLALPYKTPTQENPISESETDVEIRRMSDIAMEKISWLWRERIACGKISVIAGIPGLGKSQVTANFAALITTGGRWPDTDESAPLGNVIILSSEDDPADTILPRLVAAGADVSRCYVLEAVKINEEGKAGIRTVDLTQDIERIGREVERIGNIVAIFIDPFSAYMGKTDSNKNAEVRGLLAVLSAMAAKNNVAMMLVTHLNKSTTQAPIDRIIGSIGLIAAARSGYIVTKDQKNPEVRYFLPIKNNIGNDVDGFAFKIEGVTLAGEIETSKICWQPELVDAHKILYPEAEPKPTQTNGAKDFLREYLADGAKLAKSIFEEAEGAGYSKASIQRASRGLGIKRKKQGMDGGWEWHLPTGDDAPEEVEGVEDSTDFDMTSSVGI